MIWLNGNLCESAVQLSLHDKITLGMTVFTTLRATNGNIQDGHAHIQRLRRHAACLGIDIPYDDPRLLSGLSSLAGQSGAVHQALRVQVSAGEGARGLSYPDHPTVFMTAAEIPDPDNLPAVSVRIDPDHILYSGDLMNRIKSGYAVRALARKQAQADGYDDVVFLNERGEVTSASIGNLVIRRGTDYLTPPVASGVIDGITRAKLMKCGRLIEKVLTKEDFERCDAAWIINSLGIRSIICIDTLTKPQDFLE